MRLGLSAIALAMSAVTACPAAAQDRPGLPPSTPWTLDYDTDSCALRRMFGEGEEQAYLEFRRFQPGLGLQAVIGSSRMKARRPVEFRYRFGSDADWREVSGGNSLTLGNGFSGVLFDPVLVQLSGYEAIGNLPEKPEYEEIEDSLEKEAHLGAIDARAVDGETATRTDTLTLRGAFRRELTLQLGPLDAPLAALNECIDELMTHWDIDVEAHKTLTRTAVPINLPEVGSMIDYPPKMLRRNMPGVVNVRLSIDETGRITACHIQMPLSDPSFEETSCVDIQHALEFEPALDKDGKPIASYWVTRVHFRIG